MPTPNPPHLDPVELPQRVAVLGLGQMGLVVAAMLAEPEAGAGRGVTIWGRDADEAGRLAQSRRTPRLAGLVLPEAVRVAWRVADALAGADLIVSAVPVQALRQVWTGLRAEVPPTAGIVSVAKGLEVGTLLRPTRIIAEVLTAPGGDDPDARPRRLAALSGPTIAAELARCLPATMIAASDDAAFAKQVQRLFSSRWIRVYTNPDVLGVELAGAVKNVIAIAAGIIDGLQAGNNAKSALLARGLAEIARLGAAMGASPETFAGIAGVGDLATSCFSPEGRNRSCGEALGRGAALAEYLAGSPHVVEGVETTRAVIELARRYRVPMPITEAVHAVLFEGLDPVSAITRLMSRELKDERRE